MLLTMVSLDRSLVLPVAPPITLPARPPAAAGLRRLLDRLVDRLAPPGAHAPLVAVNLAAVAFFLLSFSRHGVGFGPYRIDLDVYRIGSQVWLRHGDLYGLLPATGSGVHLPFSYPPIAAVLLAPLALMPFAAADTVLTLATVATMALVLRMFLQSAAGREAGSWRTVCWLLPLALFLEPVRNTLWYGQVNVLLMALVTADCLLPEVRWPRGALVGLAAAVKLTPAAFVLFFLCRGDRRAALTVAASFGAVSAAGFALSWHDSVRYWTSIIVQTGRPGSPAYAANQSIEAVLARAGLDPHTPAGMATWLALSAVVLALAWRGMRRALALAGPSDAWALTLNALAALLISPISWSHHWVWVEPALLALAVVSVRGRHRAGPATAVAGLVLFAASPQWWFPNGDNREIHWAAWEQVIGSSYVIAAVAVLLFASLRPRALLNPGREQVHDLGDADRALVGTPFGRLDPAQVGPAVELRERVPERGRGRIRRKRGGDVVGEIAALRAFRR
jgi:alpha-1,2-mannosyltransferase